MQLVFEKMEFANNSANLAEKVSRMFYQSS